MRADDAGALRKAVEAVTGGDDSTMLSSVMTSPLCVVCGAQFAPRPTPGRPRVYCSSACKVRAYRERMKRDLEPPTFPAPPTVNVPPAKIRAQIIEATDALFAAEESAPPAEQLARLIIEARTIAYHAGKLEPLLPPTLSWRAYALGEQITLALARLFPLDPVRDE